MNLVQKRFFWITGSTFSLITMLLFMLLMGRYQVAAQDNNSIQEHVEQTTTSKGLGLVGAGIAFGLAALGAGIAVASVGAAALGVLSEKPQMIGQAFMFVALGEGIVIFGFVMAFMIMNG